MYVLLDILQILARIPKPAVSDGNTTFIRKSEVPRSAAPVTPGI